MENFALTNRYNDKIPFIWDDSNQCYYMSTENIAYVSIHNYSDSQDIFAVDPEGLFMIAVGSELPTTGREVSFIEFADKGYNIYLK